MGRGQLNNIYICEIARDGPDWGRETHTQARHRPGYGVAMTRDTRAPSVLHGSIPPIRHRTGLRGTEGVASG